MRIPAIVDRQESLLNKPIVKNIVCFNAAVNPHNATAMSALLRSEVVCFIDKELHKFVKSIKDNENLFQLLINFVKDGPAKNMFKRWYELSKSRELITLLEELWIFLTFS